MTRAVLLFAREPSAAGGFGRRLGRLRWKRWLGEASVHTTDEPTLAAAVFAGAQVGVLVGEETAIPQPVSEILELASGRVLPALGIRVEDLAPVHTLRELEQGGLPSVSETAGASPQLAVLFDPAAVPPASAESLAAYAARIRDEAALRPVDPGFRALLFEEPSDHPRPELVELLPRTARNLCDVGCSAGGVGAAWKRVAGGRVTGIESDPRAARVAAGRLDRVLTADALEGLQALGREEARFDAFLFADILEHLEDPVRALWLARRLAEPGARLIVSVPNVGHLSLVRDLVAGRFDPLPAGLADVGHLRWFSRDFLREALEEAGWRVEDLRGLPGAPAPDTEGFLGPLTGWEGLDRRSLETYQWVAIGHSPNEKVALPNDSSLVWQETRTMTFAAPLLEEGEKESTFLFNLESPASDQLRFGYVNRFSGVLLDYAGKMIRGLRVHVDGEHVGDFWVDQPSSDVAQHLPHLTAARNCRFEFDLMIGRTAESVRLEAVREDNRSEPALVLDLREIRLSSNKLRALQLALAEISTPPAEIVALTQGHQDTAAYRASITAAAMGLNRYLADAGIRSDRITTLLDFGCGSGRVLLGWYLDNPRRLIFGCDSNAVLTAWAKAHLPETIQVDRTSQLPPLPYGKAQFDAISAISVFTHLSFHRQQLWAGELARLLKPEGILILTLHGRPYVQMFAADRLDEFDKSGHIELERGVEGTNEFASFHTPTAARMLFPGFEMLKYFPAGRVGGNAGPFLLAALQDVYILKSGGQLR